MITGPAGRAWLYVITAHHIQDVVERGKGEREEGGGKEEGLVGISDNREVFWGKGWGREGSGLAEGERLLGNGGWEGGGRVEGGGGLVTWHHQETRL